MSAPLAITCGDPAGIGPEVVAAWLAAHPDQAAGTVVIGPVRWLASLPPGTTKVPVGLENFAATPGRPEAEGARVAWAALERAAAGCAAGEFSGVVTAPVSKAQLAAIGWKFPGQTEYFSARWGGEPTMAFCGGRMRVVLLTWHIPYRVVPEHLTASAFERAVRAAARLGREYGAPVPRIGVCGLNPHAGEGGLLGSEEKDIIDPLLARLRPAYPGLSTAQPGDTVFARHLRGEFDVVVALYHDQGLGPLKAVEFDAAVNVTLGLPHLRTSPDHGTAFGLAGTGRADPTSFANAVAVARKLAKRADCNS